MTDNEIIKALEYCIIGYCDGCECRGEYLRCRDKLDTDALALIKRQQAEIDRLKMLFNDQQEIIADLEWTVENEGFKHLGKMYSELRAEAIKEFVVRCSREMQNDRYIDVPHWHAAVEDMQKVMKEMVGNSNA